MNRFTSILLAGLIASASALAISPKAHANTPASYLAELDSYSYDRNDNGNYERQNRHQRNGDYDRDNHRRYDRDNNRRNDRERDWGRG
jgi:outer membrane lipoprotein-sorting protein